MLEVEVFVAIGRAWEKKGGGKQTDRGERIQLMEVSSVVDVVVEAAGIVIWVSLVVLMSSVVEVGGPGELAAPPSRCLHRRR